MTSPLYRLPGPHPGLVQRGNIDILRRALLSIPNPHGGHSSVYSTSFTVPQGMPHAGREVLIPRVIHQGGRWQIASPRQAWDYYRATGKNLGVFKNPAAADRYAQLLHLQQALERARPRAGVGATAGATTYDDSGWLFPPIKPDPSEVRGPIVNPYGLPPNKDPHGWGF